MGATKRLSEFILQAFAENNIYTSFSMVRFGNVIRFRWISNSNIYKTN